MKGETQWQTVQISDVAKCQGGSAFSPALQGRREGDFPFYKVSDMNLPANRWRMMQANNYVNASDTATISGTMKPADSVVFPKVGAAIHTNKKRLLSGSAFIDNNMMAVWSIDRERCLPEFLYAFFLTVSLSDLANAGPLPSINGSRLQELAITLPPASEQHQIIAVLEKVQAAISFENDLYSTAQKLKRAAMRELFTRGLRGEAQKETEIGLMPESWEFVRLETLGKIGNGSTPKKSVSGYWEGGTFPWLTSAKVYDREIETADQFVTQQALDECHLPLVKPGAVLIAITGQGKTLGNAAVLRMEATINQHLAYLQTDTQQAEPSFVRGYLETQYDYLRQIASGGGSTKGALTCAFLRSLPVPLPAREDSLDEQREIVAILDAIDRKIALHRQKRAVLDELFKALLHKLMTGEIRVADLDLSALETSIA